MTAARILRELGFDRDLTVYFVGSVMEEDCDGLCWKYIIEEEKIRPDIVICTEPTDCNIYRGQRGRMEIEVAFRGISFSSIIHSVVVSLCGADSTGYRMLLPTSSPNT